MPRTSKKHLDEKLKNRIWSGFLAGIKKSGNEKELKEILQTALTDDEIVLMEKRMAVKILLKEKVRYREISRIIDMSRTTVNFIRDNFKRPSWKKRVYSQNKFASKKQPRRYGRKTKYGVIPDFY